MADAARLRHPQGPKAATPAVPGWRHDREQLAWAAGFFDGEGYTGFSKRRNGDGTARTWRRIDLQVNQTSREVLDRFRLAVGMGRVNGPYNYVGSNKSDHWQFAASGFHQVQAVIARLWPFLTSTKRDQARNALLAYRESGESNS